MSTIQGSRRQQESPPKYTFSAPIQRAGLPFLYRVGMLVSAIVLVLLPVIYLLIIAATGYLVYLHAVHDVGMLNVGPRGRGKIFVLVAYLAPIIAGAVLILFMIKPLFARRVERNITLDVSRREEPVLFGLVDRLCAVVGAPKPKKIIVDTDVNASASIAEGIIGWIRRDLVLTIGLPLVAGLTAREFVGVLAHEFGHFSQGSAMRLNALVYRVNRWFARVAYERDAWDEYLKAVVEENPHWALTLIVLLAQLCVGITRLILKLLMLIAHAVSAMLMRQMEYDADRYQARVVGSPTAINTFDRIGALAIAGAGTFAGLEDSWRARQLPDDLPLLVRQRSQRLSPDAKKAVAAMNGDTKTRWFDTHPCTSARIASMRKENAKGVFNDESPATEIFTDFPELSKLATVAFYTQILGKNLQPEHIFAVNRSP